MKRWMMILPLLVAALAFSAVSSAKPSKGLGSQKQDSKSGGQSKHGDHGGKGDHGGDNGDQDGDHGDDHDGDDNDHGDGHGGKTYGPYQFENTDNGCQGTPWANLHETRNFKVKQTGTNTYRVTRTDKGTFTTIGGVSPGNCPQNQTAHGTAVLPGKNGEFGGYLTGTVTGTLNPTATCNLACGSDTSVFITTVFGPSATFSCFSNSNDCKFDYKYEAPGQALLFHHWQDKGTGAGTQLNEIFRGDIAST